MAETAPQCSTPGCTRPCTFDSEPPVTETSYYSTCDRCGTVSSSAVGHAHEHSFTEAQAAANGGPRTWRTATLLRPVVENDMIVAWRCSEPTEAGYPCRFAVTADELNAARNS